MTGAMLTQLNTLPTVGILWYLTLPLQKTKLRKRSGAGASICLILAVALVMRSVFHLAQCKMHSEELVLCIKAKELQQVQFISPVVDLLIAH